MIYTFSLRVALKSYFDFIIKFWVSRLLWWFFWFILSIFVTFIFLYLWLGIFPSKSGTGLLSLLGDHPGVRWAAPFYLQVPAERTKYAEQCRTPSNRVYKKNDVSYSTFAWTVITDLPFLAQVSHKFSCGDWRILKTDLLDLSDYHGHRNFISETRKGLACLGGAKFLARDAGADITPRKIHGIGRELFSYTQNIQQLLQGRIE